MTKRLTEQECLEIGGHCYVDGRFFKLMPPPYTRTCKHCGKKQIGREQDSIVWSDR